MKNEKSTTRRNPLLPLIALAIGLFVPVYAFATGSGPDNDCEQCHLDCSAQSGSFMAQCAAWYGQGTPGFYSCVEGMVASCHTSCWQGVCQN